MCHFADISNRAKSCVTLQTLLVETNFLTSFEFEILLNGCLGHSLGSSRKSVHERHRNSDGLQVKWSVFRAIWLKRQDP